MKTTILHLPDELLLKIALSTNVAALQNTALTCQQLRPIAQEALVRTAALSQRHVWQLVSLLKQRPQLVRLMSHMCLGWHESKGQRSGTSIQQSALTNQGFATCCDTIRTANPSLHNWKWIFAIRTERDFQSVGFSLLIALASNLKELTLHVTSIDGSQLLQRIFCSSSDASFTEWYDQVATVLQSRLETLIVADSRPEKLKAMFDLSRFHGVKHLTVPLDKMKRWRKDGDTLESIRASAVLPRALETIRFCATPWRLETAYIEELVEDLPGFPRLQLVELCFPENFVSTAYALSLSISNGMDEADCLQAFEKAPFATRVLVGTLQSDLHRPGWDDRDEVECYSWQTLNYTPADDLFAGMQLCTMVIDIGSPREHDIVSDAIKENWSYEELDRALDLS